MRMKILPALLALSFVFFASPTFAVGKPTGLPSQAKNRLTNGNLTSCQARENSITQRMLQLVAMVKNMETKFDATASRVENYYTSTIVPSGKTVAKYDTLVADIQIKKDIVQKNLVTAQTNFANFSCTANNPKGLLTQFRTDMQVVKKSLHDYRTSIKNLIVAVRSVASEVEKAE